MRQFARTEQDKTIHSNNKLLANNTMKGNILFQEMDQVLTSKNPLKQDIIFTISTKKKSINFSYEKYLENYKSLTTKYARI